MINAPVQKDILDSQMTVVRNEMEAGENNPIGALAQRAGEQHVAQLRQEHDRRPRGRRERSDRSAPGLLQEGYQPDNAVVIIAGKFDEPAAVRLLAQKFGLIPKPARTLDRTYTMDRRRTASAP